MILLRHEVNLHSDQDAFLDTLRKNPLVRANTIGRKHGYLKVSRMKDGRRIRRVQIQKERGSRDGGSVLALVTFWRC